MTTDTPTPAPTLTGEQIDELTETVRADFVTSAADEDEIRADHETFARWYAAVIARAKREERELIARGIANLIDAARVKQETEDVLNPDRDGDLGYRNGELDGLSNALLITGATR